jgi:hypothetical protein
VQFGSHSDSSNPGISANCATDTPGYCPQNYTEPVTGPKVDILFVDDNSASMSFEQKALANRFSGFINNLDSQHVDYRIAITTTDISNSDNPPSVANGQGALQDGKLIGFGVGNYLTPSVSDRIARFNNTIVRPETLACEQWIANNYNNPNYTTEYKHNCPSGDERGVYAANLALKNNSGFLRSDAYLAVIFVSDEDERSGFYCGGPNNPNCTSTGYPLEELDQPASLASTFSAIGKSKVAEVHSVVVTDSTCLNEQNTQTAGMRGSMGSVYLTFAQAGWGEAVSICLNNYATGLQTIANKIAANKGYALKCSNPINLQVTAEPATAGFSWTRNGSEVLVTNPPIGGNLRFKYYCPNSN